MSSKRTTQVPRLTSADLLLYKYKYKYKCECECNELKRAGLRFMKSVNRATWMSCQVVNWECSDRPLVTLRGRGLGAGST